MVDAVEKLFQQHREEVVKRLDRIEGILQKYLVIEDRVHDHSIAINDLRVEVGKLRADSRVTSYRRDWVDKIVQSLIAGASVSVIVACGTYLISLAG